MAIASETGLFEVMEMDEEEALMIFAEDQLDQNDITLDIDLTNNSNKSNIRHHMFRNKNNQNVNNLNHNKKNKRFKSSRIEVVVRKRPMNHREFENGESDIGKVYSEDNRITICEPRLKVDLTKYNQYHEFQFDHCFDANATNEQIYETCVKPLFNTILKVSNNDRFAGKATCFGYGQTGSGKTYTLLGSHDHKTGKYNEGLYAMAVRDLFKYLPSNNEIIVSFYEIYGGKLFDLLADRKQILCREDGKQKVNIIGLKRTKCESVEFLMNIISAGNTIRQTGSTGANNASSRSHAILSMDILPIGGRLSFIDLAGSERGADTQSNNKQTRLEGAEINKSLLALKECIRALDMNSIHKPFRGSKLTQVLKESFIGNSRTLMVANISPNSGSCENTLNTLRYAYRVKQLKNNNKANDANTNVKSKSMSRNRSEPSLSVYKPVTRPSTAKKRPKNNGNDRKNNKNHNHRIKKRKVQIMNNAENKREITPILTNNARRQIKKPSPPKFKNGVLIKNGHGVMIKNNKKPIKNNTKPIKNYTNSKGKDKVRMKKQSVSRDSDSDISMLSVVDNAFNTTFTKKQLIKAHRKHIDEFMILIKEDMQLLKGFDKDEFTNNEYQKRLRDVLDRQVSAVKRYNSKVFNN